MRNSNLGREVFRGFSHLDFFFVYDQLYGKRQEEITSIKNEEANTAETRSLVAVNSSQLLVGRGTQGSTRHTRGCKQHQLVTISHGEDFISRMLRFKKISSVKE